MNPNFVRMLSAGMPAAFARCLVLSLALCLALAAPARAEIVTFAFTAEQNAAGVQGAPTPGAWVDTAGGFATLTGTFTYDTEAASFTATGSEVYFTGDLTIDQFALGGYDLRQTSITNGFAGFDRFTMSLNDDTNLQLARLQLNDATATAFSSFDLPTLLALSMFQTAFLELADDTSNVLFNLTSLSLVQAEVPLPAALPLFLAGLAGVGAASRRTRTREAACGAAQGR